MPSEPRPRESSLLPCLDADVPRGAPRSSVIFRRMVHRPDLTATTAAVHEAREDRARGPANHPTRRQAPMTTIRGALFDVGGVVQDSPLHAIARYERDHG